MCDISGGRATAEAIPGAEMIVIEGMGHNLPHLLWPRLASLIVDFIQRVEIGRKSDGYAPSLAQS
jgi:pimeloyl-ACP methyl ester carboxylesterase